MAGSLSDKFTRVSDSDTGRPVVSSLASSKALGATSIVISDATNWTLVSKVHFKIYTTTTVAGVTIEDTTTQTDWIGTLSGTTISNLTLTGGTDRTYNAGATVELTNTAKWAKDMYDGFSVLHNPDGTFKNNAISNAAQIADGIIGVTELIPTIFSTLIQGQTNTGTAGGAMNYVNVGGIKLLWGTTAALSTTAGGVASGTVVFPTSFFSTAPEVLTSGSDFTGTARIICGRNAPATTTSVLLQAQNVDTVAGTAKVTFFAIGS